MINAVPIKFDIPTTVAFCGHGRSGKDTAGEFLSQMTPLRYTGSLSWAGLPYMAERLGRCQMSAWDNRHKDRERWKQYLDEFRGDDPTKLIKMSLKLGEVVVGIRDKSELLAAKAAGLISHFVWIARDVPEDPTVTFTKADCDWVITNDGCLETFRNRVAYWAGVVGLPLKRDVVDPLGNHEAVYPVLRPSVL